jgi:hypothetical protein
MNWWVRFVRWVMRLDKPQSFGPVDYCSDDPLTMGIVIGEAYHDSE